MRQSKKVAMRFLCEVMILSVEAEVVCWALSRHFYLQDVSHRVASGVTNS